MDVYNLRRGMIIRITNPFRDYQGQEFHCGAILHFEERHFLPYHAGHTLIFKQGSMYLCDNDDTAAIVQNQGDQFWEVIDVTREADPGGIP